MNRLHTARKWLRPILCVLGIAAVYLSLYAMNCHTGLYLDDYNYSYAIYNIHERVTSVKQVVASMECHYNAMNGRVVLHFLDQLMLMHGRTLFNIINPLAFCLLGILIYYQGFGTLRNMRLHWLFFLYFALYFLTPAFGQSYLWATGACNYLYGVTFILTYLIPWRSALNSDPSLKLTGQIFMCGIMLLFGILVGWTNENLSMCLIALEIGYLVADIIRHRKLQLWKVLGLLGTIAGLALLMCAPGTIARSARLGGYGTLIDCIGRALMITNKLGQYFWPLFIVLAILLGVALYQCGRRQENPWSVLWFPVLLLMGAGISLYAMSASPTFPDRVWSGVLVMCLVVLSGLYKAVDLDGKILRRCSLTAVSLAAVVLCLHCCKTIQTLREIEVAYEAREAYILEQKEAGNLNIIVPPIESSSRFAVVYGSHEVLEDPNLWPNDIMAIYYGVESITAGSDFGVPYK